MCDSYSWELRKPAQRAYSKAAELSWQYAQDVQREAAAQIARDARAVAEALIKKVA